MYRYINVENTAVVHIPTSRCIYLDQPATAHSENYLNWLAEGNIPIECVTTPIFQVDRKSEIITQLAAIDAKSVRPLREGDDAYLATLAAQATALRAELKTL